MGIFRIPRNLYRILRNKPIDYIYMTFKGDMKLIRESKGFVRDKIIPGPEYTFDELWQGSQILMKSRKVKGIIINLNSLEMNASLATLESLRDLMLKWKDSEKFVVIHSNQYDFVSYYLATAADKIFMTKGGTLSSTGVSMSRTYYKDFLESYGIKAQVAQVTPYKAALNFVTYDDMPDEQKENIEWLRDTAFEHIREAMASSRGKTLEETEGMINRAPLYDLQALEEGWIDDLISSKEIAGLLAKLTQTKVHITEFGEALKRIPTPRKRRVNIAIIPAIGSIVDGDSENELPIPIPIIGNRTLGDQSFNQIIRQVKKSKNIKGTVIYVDSPGGSATASESMLLEIEELAKKMPVVAYFNNVAASGGYYISMYSSAIVAQPLTITASIGVINGKVSLDEFYKKRKMKHYNFSRGENANIQNSIGLWDEKQKKNVNEGIFRIFDLFKDHVSRNRKISVEEVDKIAGGRVYFGIQANELKLVDKIGNLFDAVDLAAYLSKVSKISIEIQTVPKKFMVPDHIGIEAMVRNLEKISGKPQLIPYDILNFKF